MTARSLTKKINNFVGFLIENELVLDFLTHAPISLGPRESLVSWKSPYGGPNFHDYESYSFKTYEYFLNQKQFSFVLYDGAIVQITYSISGNKITGHRLNYVPCPFVVFDEEIFQSGELLDYLKELSAEEFQKYFRQRTAFRFDYDIASSSENHPASHLHTNYDCCRIPVTKVMDLKHFVKFIFENFYPEKWEEKVKDWSISGDNPATVISNEDTKRLHVHWND